MSNLSINDGEPITYDLLAEMIKRINSLDAKINANRRAASQKITVAGPQFKAINNITMICDSFIFEVGQKQANKLTIKFPAANFGAVPHVVATVADLDAGKADVTNAPYATISIGKVTKSQFDCRVDLIKVSAKNTQLKVNYIAIGKSSD